MVDHRRERSGAWPCCRQGRESFARKGKNCVHSARRYRRFRDRGECRQSARHRQKGGEIDINRRGFEEYFPTAPLQNTVLQPLQTVKLANAYDISINATGGGASGQAGAARLAISRALLQVDINLRATLKADGLLRRDPRM